MALKSRQIKTKNKGKRGRPAKGTYSAPVKVSANTTVSDLRPKDADLQYYGGEPDFSVTQPELANRRVAINKAYNWYSHFFSTVEAKEFLVRYLEDTKNTNLKLAKKIPENKMITTVGWLARMATRGLVLDQSQTEYFNNGVTRLLAYVQPATKEEATTEDTSSNRANVQEVMRERASDAQGDIDTRFDAMFAGKCDKDFLNKDEVVEILKSYNLLPQHIAPIVKHWKNIGDEFEAVIKGKDEDLVEGYASYSKKQMKNMLAFAEQVVSELNDYVSLKAATKKVRVSKPVPVEKLVKRLRHCKVFKDAAQKLDLVGLPPAKLHGATEAWVYDTKHRKMHHYVADDYSKSLSVKGNKVLGFDKNQSEVKTLRKPAEQIKNLTGSKPAARKFFDSIKAVSVAPKGRFSTDLIILKAF